MIDLLKYWLFTIMIGGTMFFAAYSIAKMFSGSYIGARGRIPSWKFRIRKYRIHLHHWFISIVASLLLVMYYTSFSFIQFTILLGISLGVAAHGIKSYSDWKHIIIKE